MKGMIALDIDGTAAIPSQPIAEEVAEYLQGLAKQGWVVLFVTGRALHWALKVVDSLRFPFFLACYNGAVLLEMPMKNVIKKKFLSKTILNSLQKICQQHASSFVVYAENRFQDVCYYVPATFSSVMLDYLRRRSAAFGEKWEPLVDFEGRVPEEFPSVKCFGEQSDAQKVATLIEQQLHLHVPLIRDPFHLEYYVAQATHPDVTKGQALIDLSQYIGCRGPIIAAGDDHNDLSMFAQADHTIVMETAPPPLFDLADVIAPSAERHGIIKGIQDILMRIYTHNRSK